MADGIGCTCAAWSANECCCGVDWTPKELIELRERCAFYERTNAEQATILNRVIAERDDYRAALSKAYQYAAPNAWDQRAAIILREALAKHSPEDEIERARRMV